ncbi:MAG: pyruvate formate lyase-activating protein [Clostridia bacterium]|nr:pyruvate formate lyase-activating protein [Clostridia bacterium]
MKGYVHSFESFGTVDGPGLRFVVFLQGCPMRCLYCHNPDTWEIGTGEAYEAGEIIKKMERNLPFYQHGGITASGGEPLLQIDFLTELFALAKSEGIHTCLDTSGVTFNPSNTEKIDKLLEYCDLVMLDIKHIDNEEHLKLTGHSNDNILAFCEHLKRKNVKMRVRHVIVPGITYDPSFLRRLGEYLRGFDNLERVEVLPYHTLGLVKYEHLGLDYPLADTKQLSDKDATLALKIINEAMEK